MTHGRSTPRTGRVATTLCVVGCLVAWLAGCVNVPTGGRVATGRAVENAGPVDDPYVRLIPVPPGQNWLPAQIVEGFITASAAFDDRHAVAKMYLAPGVDWEPDPRPGVTVYDGSLDIAPPVAIGPADDGIRVRVTGRRLGTISTDGQYQATSGGIDDVFQVGKDAHGQWRITALPDGLRAGLLLGQRDVDRAFRTLNLYFFGPDGTVLVPNPVFLPLINRRDLPGQLVRAVLSGPTSWLSGAVRTEFPPGTRLMGDRVDVTDGVATVNLSRQAAKGSPSGMSAQLMWTLRQLPEVNHLRLQIDGETVSPPGFGAIQSPGDWRGNDADALAPRPGHSAGQAVYLRDDEGQVQQFDRRVEPVGRPGTVRLWHPAVSLDERFVAGLTKDRDAVLVSDPAGAAPRSVRTAPDPGGRFITPSWDRRGALWMVENHSGGSRLWVKEQDRKPVEVSNWELAGQTVRALRVARDGVRIAAIVDAGGHEQIRIGRVVRGSAGRVTNVSEFLPISSVIVHATDLAWRNVDELDVLGSTPRQPQMVPYQVPVNGGSPRAVGTAGSNIISITALPHASLLVGMLVPEKGKQVAKICRQSDERDPISEWKCFADGHDPTYPG
jgi:hypothetical protein